jgi:polyferredoxin
MMQQDNQDRRDNLLQSERWHIANHPVNLKKRKEKGGSGTPVFWRLNRIVPIVIFSILAVLVTVVLIIEIVGCWGSLPSLGIKIVGIAFAFLIYVVLLIMLAMAYGYFKGE